ncbi:MAG: hypothetical protein OXP08_10320, partial [bacterium]|nr:hypothetical protein [bacterium]
MLRKHMGRLLIVAAGGGCLAVLIFVVPPMMDEPAPPATQDGMAAEVQGTDASQGDEAEPDAVMRGPSPLVGVWNDGREGAVSFRAAEWEADGPPEPVEAIAVHEGGLPQVLSEQDVAEARAALEGEEPEADVAVEPGAAGESEQGAMVPDSGEDAVSDPVAAPVPESTKVPDSGAGETDMEDKGGSEGRLTVAPAPDDEAREEELEAMIRAVVRAVVSESEVSEETEDDGTAENGAELPARRGEFDVPVYLDSRAPREVSQPSGGVPESAAPEAAQAGNAQHGLSLRAERAGVIVPGTLRGVMGYRLPLVSRQEVPDQIVSGVLIPAHTTFVILEQGAWE